MKIETFIHENVLPNGTFKDKLGAVEVNGSIRMSPKGGGCTIKTCHCSDGHWYMTALPRTKKGVVAGTRIIFENQKEMDEFLSKL